MRTQVNFSEYFKCSHTMWILEETLSIERERKKKSKSTIIFRIGKPNSKYHSFTIYERTSLKLQEGELSV